MVFLLSRRETPDPHREGFWWLEHGPNPATQLRKAWAPRGSHSTGPGVSISLTPHL